MNFKEKHSNKLKRAFVNGAIVVGGLGIFAGLTSCDGKIIHKKQEYSDMLSRDTVHGTDIYGNMAVLKKVDLKLYADKKGTPSDIMQTCWGVENSKEWPNRTGEPTHIEKVKLGADAYLENHSIYVEVYDRDNVLVDKNCFLADNNGCLRFIGDEEHYVRNLERYNKERTEHSARSARRYERRNKNDKSDKVDEIVKPDSTVVQDTLMFEVVDSSEIKTLTDSTLSLSADTLLNRGKEMDL